MMEQTGENGFHYVDEAAASFNASLSPGNSASEVISHLWTIFVFEKVSLLICACCLRHRVVLFGGLEVASDRLLKLIDKE
jgi:hypothetical protein